PDPAPEAAGIARMRAVLGATFFVRFGFGLSLAIFATYVLGETTGLDTQSVGTIGIISAMAPVGEFTTVLFSGNLADRYGRFPVLLFGTGGAAALLALLSATRLPLAVGALNLAFGVASGGILAASLAVVGDEAQSGSRGYEMGRFDALNLLGWIGGFAVGFALLGSLAPSSLSWVLRLGAVAQLGGLFFAFRTFRRHPEGARGAPVDWKHIRTVVFRREILLVTLPWLVIYLLLGTAFVFLGTASAGIHLPFAELGAIIGGGGLLLLATQPAFGRLADRHGRMRMMLIGTVGFVGVLLFAGLLLSFGAQPVLLAGIAVSALAGLAYGPAALAALTDLSQSITRGTTMAIYTLSINLGMLLGLLLSTTLYSAYGPVGLDVFFAGVGLALSGLTALRYDDQKLARDLGAAPR
ncbi:MAG: MFS transporter, partial [Candidatus Lutacidiplasmatales archaeon]